MTDFSGRVIDPRGVPRRAQRDTSGRVRRSLRELDGVVVELSSTLEQLSDRVEELFEVLAGVEERVGAVVQRLDRTVASLPPGLKK